MDESRARELEFPLAPCGENLPSPLAFDLVSIRCCKIDDPHDHNKMPKAGQVLPRKADECHAWPGAVL